MIRAYMALGVFALFLIMGGYIKFLLWQLGSYKAQAEQSAAQLSVCIEQYKNNQEIMDDYQKNIDALHGRLNALKLRYKGECVPIIIPPEGNHGAEGTGHAGKNGVPVGELLDYASQCERIRLQLGAAQRYIKGDK